MFVIGRAAPELRFKVQESAVEVGAGIGDKFGLNGIENDDFILKSRQELGGTAAHQFGYPIAAEQMAAIT